MTVQTIQGVNTFLIWCSQRQILHALKKRLNHPGES